MKRRTFIRTCTVTAGAGYFTPFIGCGRGNGKGDQDAEEVVIAPSQGNALPFPPLDEGKSVDGIRVFDLTLQKGQKNWVGTTTTPTYGINGDFLGPTLRIKNGEKIKLRVKNTLGETATIHWHGLHLPAASDGGPYSPIADGTTWEAGFTVKNEAMTAWYHPHQMHKTARHVYMGMAGFIIVDDPQTTHVLPQTYGVDDIPLVFQDRHFFADGSHPYSEGKEPSHREKMAGVKGSTMLVNGAVTPTHTVTKKQLRLRLLNGSNARIYHIGFQGDHRFQQIATDGGLLEKPISKTRLLLSPGERAEIVVDFSTLKADLIMKSFSSEVKDLLFSSSEGGGGMGGGMAGEMLDEQDQSTFTLMTFKLGAITGETIAIPENFGTITRLSESKASTLRPIVLSMASGSVFINDQQMLNMNNVHTDINYQIALNSIEVWEVKNTSPMAHPFHIHNVQFQVLERGGKAATDDLLGWKDTLLLHPGESARIIMKFDDYADSKIPYMFHCHILEHEDAGMMGQFYVV